MIPVTLLGFQIEGADGFDAGRVPGSSLRGALYAALRIMYDTEINQSTSTDVADNPVAWLLRMEDEERTGGKDVPRAMSLRPFTHAQDRSFGVALFGKAHELYPLIVSAVPTMGQLGVGPGRSKFRLINVTAVDPLTNEQKPLWDDQGSTSSLDTVQPMTLPGAVGLPQEGLTIDFLTPTRIISQGHLCHEPVFQTWFQRLLERVRNISKAYTDDPVWIPFTKLLEQADQIKLVQDKTRWVEGWSGSRRDGMVKPLGGFRGKAVYEGEFRELMPYIRLGQALQVGKNTVKGCGWYTLR